ncbi:hypothetical protein [Nodularia sp. UHCC 0506]|uniref:hypothetical protein n=1 Tax=Nodularia sp. UHCC 0506 TaxID=3110243 RepID=UPI002B1F9703|nr:hypothetical protein [Nodularia sp. UHCC 0506]MEA5515532.1 hypothetical protein [Nodularia sp. UHCC 0506]
MLFDPGTGTLKSVSVEAAFVEAAQLLELAEEAAPIATDVNFTDVSHDNTAKTFDIAASIPVDVTISPSGQPTFSATAYVSPAFTTGGDINATSLPSAVLELAHLLQDAERASETNPNNINIQYDTDAGTASITASIPCVRSVEASGKVLTTVTPYLA